MADKGKMDSSGSSLSSTRQLLDELDALMQRMLALPVGDASSAAGSESEQATTVAEPPPETPQEETTTNTEAGPTEPNPSPVAAERSPAGYQYDETESEQPSGPTMEEGSAPVTEAAEPAPTDQSGEQQVSPKLRPVAEDVLSALAARPSRLQSELLAQQARRLEGLAERPRWWLWPLSLPSRLFDLATYLLGPLGSWLRTPGGHTFLGVVGLLLLLAALGLHLLVWLSWN